MSGRDPGYLTRESIPIFCSLSKSDFFDIAVSLAAQVSESLDDPGGEATVKRLIEEVEALEGARVIPRGSGARIDRLKRCIAAKERRSGGAA